jgi:hypothetical protein
MILSPHGEIKGDFTVRFGGGPLCLVEAVVRARVRPEII